MSDFDKSASTIPGSEILDARCLLVTRCRTTPVLFAAILLLSFTLVLSLKAAASAQTPTPEISDPSFSDIAAVFPNASSPTGAVIVYNPHICQSIGLACAFFRVHEHGHVVGGHHLNSGIPPMIRERDADHFAAANASPQAVFVAWQLFMNGGSSSNWHTYGSPVMRARRLCQFAIQASNWVGPTPCP